LVTEAPGAAKLARFTKSIALENVVFRYPGSDNRVLDGIDLEVKAGEVVALVGASGAGKTTLVNLVPRFYDPVEGIVKIDGHDLRQVRLASLRDKISIVAQDTFLFNDTVAANIGYGRLHATPEQVREAARNALAEEFILRMPDGYDTVIGERGTKMSGGQRQRLSIARALLKDAPILILDEATSHLDTESEVLVQKALQILMEHRTVIVIAHRLSTVRRADRIVVLDCGRIVESGRHDELLEQGGTYRRLYELQFLEAR
jgi:subfamily B ATP-binding cassette protein MsbA